MVLVYEYIYKRLAEKNVRDVFMYSGGAIMSLIDQFHHTKNVHRINAYISSNENHSVSAAVGYSKLLNYKSPKKNLTGVVITTSGPGLTNCVSGILDATADSTPLVVISGQVPLKAMGKNAFQEAPSTEITKSITKKNFLVRAANDIVPALEHAFISAHDRKKGAVHIDIPKCVLNSKITSFDMESLAWYNPKSEFSESLVSDVAKLINEAQRPVFYVGKGASDCGDVISRMSKKSKSFVSTTVHALGTYDEKDIMSLKMMGMHGAPQANMAIQNADLIVCLGGRFDDRCVGNVDRYAPSAQKIVFVNIEDSEFSKMLPADKFPMVHVHADCRLFCMHLEPLLKEKEMNWQFYERIQAWKKMYVFNKQRFFVELNKVFSHKFSGQEINLVCGVGNHQMYTAQYITFDKHKRLISSGSLGNMESGIPNAIGVKIADPESITCCVIGDGSFHMSCNDLFTIQKYDIDVKIFLVDNRSQDMVRCWEDLFYGGRITATQHDNNVCYASLARAYGIEYVRIDLKQDETRDIQLKIYQTLISSKAVLCHVISAQDFCLPLVPPGSALDEMLVGPITLGGGGGAQSSDIQAPS